MKTRNGFVSNSSSSSFVLTSPANKNSQKITIEVPLEKFGIKITTKKQLDEEYPSFQGMTMEEVLGEDYASEQYQAAVKALKKGKVVWLCSIGNDDYDNPVVSALYAEAETGEAVAALNPELENL